MKNATFRQLQVFESIARNRSFTVAAKELHLTQPTISVQMKKLTETVGMPLYEVMGKKVFITEIGIQLLETCYGVFNELDNFEMSVANARGVKEGVLRVSGVTTVEYFGPRIIGDFCRKYPGIKVSLEVKNRQRIIERIKNNRDDIYICGPIPVDLEVEETLFLENPLVILASPSHPLAGRKNITVEELAGEQFLKREEGCGTYLAMDKIVEQKEIHFQSSMALGSNEAIKQGVISGLGISMLSLYALTHELETKQLTILDVEGFPFLDQWHIAYPKGKKLSIVAKAFFDYLLDEGRKLTSNHLYDVKGCKISCE